MPKSLPVILINGKNICAQFEPQAPPLEAVKKDFITLDELDYYKLALIGAAILLSL